MPQFLFYKNISSLFAYGRYASEPCLGCWRWQSRYASIYFILACLTDGGTCQYFALASCKPCRYVSFFFWPSSSVVHGGTCKIPYGYSQEGGTRQRQRKVRVNIKRVANFKTYFIPIATFLLYLVYLWTLISLQKVFIFVVKITRFILIHHKV